MEESRLRRILHLPHSSLLRRGILASILSKRGILSCALMRRGVLSCILMSAVLVPATLSVGFQQKPQESADVKNKDTGKAPAPKEAEKNKEKLKAQSGTAKLSPTEILVETVIFAYGSRPILQAARASIEEKG